MRLADHGHGRRGREQRARAGDVHLLRVGVDDRHGGEALADVCRAPPPRPRPARRARARSPPPRPAPAGSRRRGRNGASRRRGSRRTGTGSCAQHYRKRAPPIVRRSPAAGPRRSLPIAPRTPSGTGRRDRARAGGAAGRASRPSCRDRSGRPSTTSTLRGGPPSGRSMNGSAPPRITASSRTPPLCRVTCASATSSPSSARQRST